MKTTKIEVLERALAREREARKVAEKILEDKSAKLYNLTQELQASNIRLESLLKIKTNELKGVFENIVDAYVVMDLHGNVLKMNHAAENLLGVPTKDTSINLMKLVHFDELENVKNGFKKLISEGSLTNFQVRIHPTQNSEKLVHINSSVIYNENNEPIAAQGIVRDITLEKEAEEKLKDSQERLALVISNLDSSILLENEHRQIALTNQRFCELFKIKATPKQLIGQDCSTSAEQSKVLFKKPNEFVDRINTILKTKETILGEEIEMADGTIIERDYIPIFKGKDYKGHLWSYRDITIQKKYKDSLQAEREKYSNIIENMKLGLIEVDNDDKILMVNQGFEEMSGYSKAELIGKKGKELLLKEGFKEKLDQENKNRLDGNSNSYEVTIIQKDGTERYWLISGAPNYNINGKVTGSIGINLDITEFKKLQLQKEALLKNLEQRNEELQEYAHVVSHDLKSPLRSIHALVSWLKEDNAEVFDTNSLENIEHIENTLEKMESLISGILSYSNASTENEREELVDLNHIISDVEQFIICPENIEISVKNKLPILKGDRTKFQQLFQNLISNAIKFNDKEKGYISIDYEEKQSFHKFTIEDNGIGIAPEYHKKIFKVFQSLGNHKDSSGIGLSIVKKIVELHKGEIWLESKEGEGSKFHFTLKK